LTPARGDWATCLPSPLAERAKQTQFASREESVGQAPPYEWTHVRQTNPILPVGHGPGRRNAQNKPNREGISCQTNPIGRSETCETNPIRPAGVPHHSNIPLFRRSSRMLIVRNKANSARLGQGQAPATRRTPNKANLPPRTGGGPAWTQSCKTNPVRGSPRGTGISRLPGGRLCPCMGVMGRMPMPRFRQAGRVTRGPDSGKGYGKGCRGESSFAPPRYGR